MLTFIIPSIHILKLNDKVLLLNRDNLRRHLISIQSYNSLLGAIQEDELKCGKYSIPMNNTAINIAFECIVKGVFYTKEKQIAQNNLVSELMGKPKIVYLYMTSQCNLHCVYCYENANHISKTHKNIELDVTKVKQLIDKIVNLGAEEVSFTGGEPLLANGLFEVASYAKSQGLHTCLLTNGTLITPMNVEKLHNFNTVKISLDSVIPKENEQTRGKGTTEHILRGMRLVKQQGLRLIVECVVNNSNYDSIKDTIAVLYNEIGVNEIRFTYMIPVGRDVDNDLILKTPFDISQKYIVEAHFEALGKRYPQILGDLMPSSSKLLAGCGAGINEIMVECDGRTYPCRMYHDDFYMGNLFEETLLEMQQKDSFQAFRRSIMVDELDDCKDCTLKYMCGGGCRPAHYGFTGDYKTNYTQWCLMTHKNLEFLLWLQENINPVTGEPIL